MKTHSDFEKIVAGKGWKSYTWGEILNVHRLGNYAVLEYKATHGSDTGEIYFHPILWTDQYKQYHNDNFYWDDTNTSYPTLEEAIIGVIGRKFDGLNSQAAGYFSRMIGLTSK